MQALPRKLWRNARKVQRDIRHRVVGVPWMDVEATDRFLFSYPRSGNTWIRHIVQHLAHGSQIDNHEALEAAMPTIDTLEFPERLSRMTEGLRFFKSHLPYAPYFLGGKIVYVVRDGRDVLISYYDYFRHIKDYSGSLDDFFKKMTQGWMRYGSWRDNVGSWVDHKDHPNILVVRFEDMRAEPFATAQQVAKFADLPSDDAHINAALDASSVEKVHSTMRSWNAAQHTQFQGGVSGGGRKTWRDRLSMEQNRAFVDHSGDLLQKLGYSID